MFKIALIHMAAFILSMPTNAKAFDYDVDMPYSGDPKMEMIRVRIDNCTTKFLIDKKDFEKFSKDSEEMMKLVKKAIARANTGCK